MVQESTFFLHTHFSKHTVDTQFCTHDLIKENDLNNYPMYTKNHDCITCINSFIAYYKNDLAILTVTAVCPVSKSDHQIKRYRMIKLHGQHALCLGRVDHT